MCITSDLVKELRLKSGIGIMECKKALVAAHGNLQQAIMILKKNGKIKAENKIKNVALRGIVSTFLCKNKYALMVELNCETDFVEKHHDFIEFASEILFVACKRNITEISSLRATFEEKRVTLVSKFNENIVIRRFFVLFGKNITSYLHRNKIGVLVKSDYNKQDVVKKIAMHIAANNPDYLSRNDIPNLIIEKERQIQLEIALRLKKPIFIANKIVDGQIEKFIKNICLLEQDCIFEPNKKIKDFIFENNIKIIQFIRFELGEII